MSLEYFLGNGKLRTLSVKKREEMKKLKKKKIQEKRKKAVPWMPGAVPDLKNWVRDLASTSTYDERSWCDLSKGRWEAKNHGLGKDAVLRPPYVEEEASASVPKPVKDNKRKRASASEDPKPKTRMARKPRKNTIPLTMESVLYLRYEDEEDEENDRLRRYRRKVRAKSTNRYRSRMLPTEVNKWWVEDIAGPSDVSGLFCEEHQALNRSITVHQETCSRSRAELHWYEADLWQKEEEIKDLRVELSKAHQDQTNLTEQVIIILKTHGLDPGTVANISISQLQQKLEVIGKLREEVDIIRVETLGWKDGMDRLSVEKETARAQLSSAENQLQSMKEKSSVQARKIEELEARLASELAKAKSDAEKAMANADALVAVYQEDAEATQVQAREVAETANTRAHWVAELSKCRSRRETLEEIHARGFDITEEIQKAKELEANAEALASDDDDGDDESKSGSESGEEPDGEEISLGDNQET
ncbi:uncharacterized protein [Nicotiana tomentosiformis]|uniref:uncharacterized protein n=1 Tax=Nicotiana tomentosiformis TaxID=4098 RepID=UPI00388C3561